MALPAAEANVHRDLVLIEQGHIFEKKRNEAFSLKGNRSRVVPFFLFFRRPVQKLYPLAISNL